MEKSILSDRVDESDETKKIFAQEELIIAVAEQIWELMEKSGLKKADLARQLNKSPAYITQLLTGSRNITLRTLSDLAYALDRRARVNICSKQEADHWHLEKTQVIQLGQLKNRYSAAPANTAVVEVHKPVPSIGYRAA